MTIRMLLSFRIQLFLLSLERGSVIQAPLSLYLCFFHKLQKYPSSVDSIHGWLWKVDFRFWVFDDIKALAFAELLPIESAAVACEPSAVVDESPELEGLACELMNQVLQLSRQINLQH